MTRTSRGGSELAALVRAHGADLHRLASALTGSSSDATELTARALADEGGRDPGRPDGSSVEDRLRTRLVRHYLRSAPRRAEKLDTPGDDAGDVLRRLAPRARAASALRLVERWSPEQTAAALRVPARRVEALVPATPGLDLALTGLADQHALSGPDLHDALLERAEGGPVASGPHRRRWLGWVAAAALPVALLAGYAADGLRDGGSASAEGRGPAAPGQDLTAAGWELDEDGDPPRRVMGLQLRETVTIDKGRRSGTVSVPDVTTMGIAAFGVLWCDMPPAEDDHLEVPAGTLAFDEDRISLPCAGRDGSPGVSHPVALPPGEVGVLEISGDMPGKGAATLAVYTETEDYYVPPPRGRLTEAPPVDQGAFALDGSVSQPSHSQGGSRMVHAVDVGSDSTVRVWAGQSGSVAVNVDGIPVTDDGDVAAMVAMAAAEWDDATDSFRSLPDMGEYADWSTQQADLRDGRWLVPVAGQVRTFSLPAQARPTPGERRTVVVEVFAENIALDGPLQVVVADARQARPDLAPVRALTEPEAPELLLGHRLVGQWQVPGDGQLRELELPAGTELPEDAVILLARDLEPSSWFSWGEGTVTRGGEVGPVWLSGDLEMALEQLRTPWFEPLPPGPGPLSAAVPPGVGHPPTTVLAYAPVPYEDFDFAAAGVPPDSSATGSFPGDQQHQSFTTVTVLGPTDLKDGEVTLRLPEISTAAGQHSFLAARVTTEGRGRMRFLVDGQPGDMMFDSDGWWSSWTQERVTSELDLAFPGSRSELVLTVVVEDYEDFTIEVLAD